MKLLRNTSKLVEEVGRTKCDECKEWVPTDSRLWHCDTCELDLCAKCGPVVPWRLVPELQVQADAASNDAEFRGPWKVVERGIRLIVGGSATQEKKELPKLDCLPPQSGMVAATRARYARQGEEELYRSLLVIPVHLIPARIA